jgi:transposase
MIALTIFHMDFAVFSNYLTSISSKNSAFNYGYNKDKLNKYATYT